MSRVEKLANLARPIYLYHAAKFPYRSEFMKKGRFLHIVAINHPNLIIEILVLIREIAPPLPKDWQAIKNDFQSMVKYLDNGLYRNLTVRVCFLASNLSKNAKEYIKMEKKMVLNWY